METQKSAQHIKTTNSTQAEVPPARQEVSGRSPRGYHQRASNPLEQNPPLTALPPLRNPPLSATLTLILSSLTSVMHPVSYLMRIPKERNPYLPQQTLVLLLKLTFQMNLPREVIWNSQMSNLQVIPKNFIITNF